jgi:hypothetical protein
MIDSVNHASVSRLVADNSMCLDTASDKAFENILHNADTFGIGEMDIGEFAHALGVVFCRPPLGDLDLAPGPMHVDADEEIDGAVAAVLVVVAFELARRGRDGLAHLADELDRALVEADHRPFGIGRFGIEVEHVFHAGDIFAVDPGNAPHVPAPWLETVFGQPPAHRLARQALVLGELDHGVGQKLQRPAGAPLRRVRASRCHQQGFLLARQLPRRSRALLLAQRPFQIAFHEAPLGPVHGGTAHRQRAGNLLIAAAGIGRQQYLGSLELAGGALAFAQHRGEFTAFGLAQFDSITYIHLDLLVGEPDESTNESKIRRRSPPQRARLHRETRPIPGLYPRIHAPAPPAACRSRHAAIFPRQPTFGSPNGVNARTSRVHQKEAQNRSQHRNAD